MVTGDSDRWHAELDLERAHVRLASAVELLGEQHVDVIAMCGDVSHHGDRPSLLLAIEALEHARCDVVIVPGNHDVEPDIAALSGVLAARSSGNVRLATDAGTVLRPGVRLAGRGEQPIAGRVLTAPDGVGSWADDLVVWVSHFPVESLDDVCSRAELPFAGDADDVSVARTLLAQRGGPTIALTGHLHIRHAASHGRLLHFGAGALVEPPGDIATIDIAGCPRPSVRRRIWESDAPPGQRLPVLAQLDGRSS